MHASEVYKTSHRHVARVLERGVTFCGGGGGGVWGSSPEKFFNLRWGIPQNLMIKISSAHDGNARPSASGIPRGGLQCTEHLKYMGTGTICGGTVVLNDLEEFGGFEADEKSISRQMPRSQMS